MRYLIVLPVPQKMGDRTEEPIEMKRLLMYYLAANPCATFKTLVEDLGLEDGVLTASVLEFKKLPGWITELVTAGNIRLANAHWMNKLPLTAMANFLCDAINMHSAEFAPKVADYLKNK